VIALAFVLGSLAQGEPDRAGLEFFETKVRPVFAEKCYACHSAGAKKLRGDLRLDTREGILKGVRPGDSDGSLLLRAIRHVDADFKMPPKERLPEAAVADVAAWIRRGAPTPGDRAGGPAAAPLWSLLPPVPRQPPPVRQADWPRTPVDRFVLARLEVNGLAPSPPADRRALLRRVTYDLTGLPPTPEEIDAFLADASPEAYERVVDRLLASPHYGERWGRHWLDVVHFGETHGYDKDKPRLNAWPYRDYVIRSFNRDTPYSRFVQEQLAGDVLFPDDPQGVVATGFIAAGPWDFVGHTELPETKTDGLIARYNDRDDMVMTAASTFVSLTVHCARCHDHKFDPIPQADYYALQAVFAGVDRADRPYDPDPAVHARRRALQAEARPLAARVAALTPPEVRKIDARLAELQRRPPADPEAVELERYLLETERRVWLEERAEPAVRSEREAAARRLEGVERRLAALPPPQSVYAAASEFAPIGTFAPPGRPRPVHVLLRGDVRRPGPPAAPGALACLPGLPSRFGLPDPDSEGLRRAALARWVTDPRNFLARRSIVNRVWHYHFGRGIVETPNDFGRMGAAPSHPELLDWLAAWFHENDESFKKLHRLLVTSAVYRQSSRGNAAAERLDADNRLLWRMNRWRLDAESFRDSLLQAAGALDPAMGGPSVQQFFFKDDHSPVYDYARWDVDAPGGARRSVYRFVVRSVPDPFVEAMDGADPSLLTPRRGTTLTALQALAALNDPFVLRQCERMADRVRASGRDPVEEAYRVALGRLPEAAEKRRMAEYAARHGLANACRVLVNSNEFAFVD
jgi:hypothetical protein